MFQGFSQHLSDCIRGSQSLKQMYPPAVIPSSPQRWGPTGPRSAPLNNTRARSSKGSRPAQQVGAAHFSPHEPHLSGPPPRPPPPQCARKSAPAANSISRPHARFPAAARKAGPPARPHASTDKPAPLHQIRPHSREYPPAPAAAIARESTTESPAESAPHFQPIHSLVIIPITRSSPRASSTE